MALRFKARSAVPGATVLRQSALDVVADYPVNSAVTNGLHFANNTRTGSAPSAGDPNTIIDTAGGNWQTVANEDVRLAVPNGLAPNVGTLIPLPDVFEPSTTEQVYRVDKVEHIPGTALKRCTITATVKPIGK